MATMEPPKDTEPGVHVAEDPVALPTPLPLALEKKRKKRKKRRDPGAPKYPMNSYNLFVKSQRQRLVQADPSKTNPDIMRDLAQMWRQLPLDQRKLWDEMADRDRVRYEDEMKRYQSTNRMDTVVAEAIAANLPPSMEEELHEIAEKKRKAASNRAARRKRQRHRDPNTPRYPLNPYNIFVKTVRNDIAQKGSHDSNPEIMKEIARQWRDLPADSKQHYRDLADKDKERYESEQVAYYKRKAEQQSSSQAAQDVANAIFPQSSAEPSTLRNVIIQAATAMAAAMQVSRGEAPNGTTPLNVPIPGMVALQQLIQQNGTQNPVTMDGEGGVSVPLQVRGVNSAFEEAAPTPPAAEAAEAVDGRPKVDEKESEPKKDALPGHELQDPAKVDGPGALPSSEISPSIPPPAATQATTMI
uniref:HMG box domain-containing protein n=2 Tax=Pinguiococcus pyrenoidosus TaxID=172671 RepID=A0A7R9U2W5_9STRA|mmetsp:Transcript_12474/g.46157  ORF Transcript_12474/g.46157 Transcript_12474/m.46157 type:complete len:414 (+) Transcript_12474:80-1321(+)